MKGSAMRLALAALPLLLPCAALAQDYSQPGKVTLYSAPAAGVPSSPLGTAGNPLVVLGSTGGGSGGATSGTVNQGTQGASSSPWYVTDAKIEALITGSGLNVNVAFPSSQAVTGTFFQSDQPVKVSAADAAASGLALSTNLPAINADGGALNHVTDFPSIFPISMTPAQATASGLALSSQLPSTLSGDGGLTVHVANTSTPVTNAPLSGAWTDYSGALTTTAATVVPAVTVRYGLHIWNNGTALACINWTSTATVSGAACGAGSTPILPNGGAYLEDQPGNVSPEAISAVGVAATSLTIKAR